MIRSSVVVAFLAISGAAFAGPLDGRWAMTPEDCGLAPGMGDRVPLTISGDMFKAYESQCTIAGVEEIGGLDSAWRVTRTCSGEGDTWSIRSIFAIDRDATNAPRQLVEIDLDEGYVIVRQYCN